MPRGTVKVRLLVFRVDMVNTNSEREDAKRARRGDICSVRLPGQVVTRNEYNVPEMIVIETDMPVGDARALTAGEPGDEKTQPLLKFRNQGIDLDALNKLVLEEEKANDVYPYSKAFWHSGSDIAPLVTTKAGAPIRVLMV